ncbi:OPA3 family protein [Rhodotorula paludigena]|uniref:OPA3 family protein n=1 Tax=Rhodotorula paludigena TaxID=86838 RepID=UPI00317A64B7
MASLKIASLLLRTLSKPIATKIKQQAKEHEGFKSRTIQMAQFLHRAEMNLRVKLLGESPRHVRPLSESKAIDAGANFLSEGFLFTVAAVIIIGETYRGKRAESKRRDRVHDLLEQHEEQILKLEARLGAERKEREEIVARERELEKIVEEIVVIGLHGGFGELPTEWKRHLAVGKLAERFRNAERVVEDEDDKDETKPECGLAATAEIETAHVEPPPADPAANPVPPVETEMVDTAPTKSDVKEQ